MEESESTFAVGAVINGRYRLDRQLGRGGMGEVYAATNLLLDAPVAIKVLHADVKAMAGVANRFLQEARAAAAVRHQNIVGIVDIGQDDVTGALYIVQEFLQGHDLKRHLALHGAMAPRAALELLLPVMRALAFAHSRNVVHRDLKPDNIFLHETPEGVVPKIIDFGIAKVTDAQGHSPQMTRTTQVLGTPYFMSPEQAAGDRAVDHRADIWSLGVVLYHMLTRRYPHEGTTVNLIITHILAHPPTPVTTYAPTLPQPVVALVQHALQYDPAARLPSMEAFWEAARRCLASLGAPLDAPPAPRSVAPAPPAARPLSTSADFPTVAPQVLDTAAAARPQRTRNALLAAIASLALLAAVAGFVWSRSPATPMAASATPRREAPQPVAARPPPQVAPQPVAALAAPVASPAAHVPTSAAPPAPVAPARVAPAAAPSAPIVRPPNDRPRVRRPPASTQPAWVPPPTPGPPDLNY